MICSYYVIVFRVLEVFRNATSELDPRLAVNPGPTRFSAGVPGDIQAAAGPG